MGPTFKRFLARNFDVVTFAFALMSVGPLMGWWSVLVRRNILSMDRLIRGQIEALPDSLEKVRQLHNLDLQTDRQLLMIGGESVTAGLLLVILAAVLFAVARHRANENRRMQTMLQLTSHQLKTPIAGVRTLLQSLENGAIPQDMQKQFLSRGVAECDRLEHLVETILAYQRAVVRRAPHLESISSDGLVGGILTHRQAMFPAETLVWNEKKPSVIRCDPDAIHVVLENLLDNARKYGGGSVELIESQQGTRWKLSVKDKGQGFAPGEVERLFEPFERGGGTGVAHGSGLGLFIARQLMRRMDGELRATSDGPGTGATFSLELPLAPLASATTTEVAHG